MQHNIRSGLSCLHEQGISYIVLYGGYAAPNRLEETVRWHGSECRRAHQPNRLVRGCEVAWLCGFTYYEKRVYYVRAEQRKKA